MRRFVRIAVVVLLLYGMGHAATPVETPVLSEATYSVGVYTISPVSVPPGYTRVYIKLMRALWLDPGTRASWLIEVSQDGGTTWDTDPPAASGSTPGGISINPQTGLPRPFSLIYAALPQPGNPNRKIRGTVTVAGGPITTTIYAGLE